VCRWLAYSGSPIALSEIIFNTEHSLIDQSLSARSDEQTTNGDGFGVGWYDHCKYPGLYKHIQPAWNDPNLRDLCQHTRSHMFLAHVRAATATAVQRTNCHPFRHRQWLFVHNGLIRDFTRLHRDLALAVAPELYPSIQGTTDSELMFYLSLQFGLASDVGLAVSKMVGLVEDIGHRRGVEHPMQMSLGISDGRSLYAFRYSSEHRSRTLFHSRDLAAVRELVPEDVKKRLDDLSDDTRVIVSEPFADLPGAWEEIPESAFVAVSDGKVVCSDFKPTTP
jgi:predicted glutamine amidotransferase